jgi:hypothetical protein
MESLFGPAAKVTAAHLAQDAYLYIRQSSLKQVVNNTEPSPSSNVLVGGSGVALSRGARAGRGRESAVLIV